MRDNGRRPSLHVPERSSSGGQKGEDQALPARQHMKNRRMTLSVTRPGRYFDSNIERNIQAVFS
ncbi:Unknown protein sequence [Pseudomonas amygdali pv. myricae]|nr:Unknown protein sequence [Pseudomonas amygdali pv. myricae]